MYCWVAALNVLVVALNVLVVRPIKDDPALGVFFWFQVTDFDRFLNFFSLCHFIFPKLFIWVVSRCVYVSDTERLTPTLNVLFWNQIVEANQFICRALAPFDS